TIYHYIQCQLQFIRLVSFSDTLVIYRILPYPRNLLQFFLLHHLQLFVHLLLLPFDLTMAGSLSAAGVASLSSRSASILCSHLLPLSSSSKNTAGREGDIHVESDAGNKRNEEDLLSCDLGGLEL
ncbi:hypothetical protein PENTCL1PPCAC_19178, partial [Pristionchus entomophagus]